MSKIVNRSISIPRDQLLDPRGTPSRGVSSAMPSSGADATDPAPVAIRGW